MFPKARKIHCQRDLRDVGFSCLLQNFSDNLTWSNDLQDIGRYFSSYQELMVHWSTVLTEPPFDVVYEDVVNDLEREVRKIIGYLDLPWDSAYLDFHNSAAKVQTASRWQVKAPIYASSVGKWRNFEEML